MRQILKQLNFSEKEIDVYLAALKLGSAPISQLAKASGVKRPNAYFILEKMKEKGLVSLAKKKNKQVFVAEKPNKLLKLLETQKEKLSDTQEEIRNILPKFEDLAKKGAIIPLFKYFEGKDGVWNIIDDLTESNIESAWVITPGKLIDVFGQNQFTKNIVLKRRQKGIKMHVIMDRHPEMIKFYNDWLEKKDTVLREYRLLPEAMDFNTLVYLYADKVAMIFLRDEISGLVIQSEELFKVFKFMFDSLWKELEGKNLPTQEHIDEARKIQLK